MLEHRLEITFIQRLYLDTLFLLIRQLYEVKQPDLALTGGYWSSISLKSRKKFARKVTS